MPRSSISISLDPQLDSAIQQMATQKNISRAKAAAMVLRYGVAQLVQNHKASKGGRNE